MQFIGTGDRILTENFNVGYLYTITFKSGNYINTSCIGIGDNFVMFQRTEPDLLFTLNVDTADEVDTIELYNSGGGTNDYDDLVNRPQINSHILTGNMSGADLGLQNTISDLDTIRAGAASGATAVQPADMTSALAAKQNVLSDAQLAAVNSGITSTDVAQIETNKNNILWNTNNGVKNIINNTAAASTESAGIVWTKNADGSMTGNGTCSGTSGVRVVGTQGVHTYAAAVSIPRGTYIVAPTRKNRTNEQFIMYLWTNSGVTGQSITINTSAYEFTVDNDTTKFDFSVSFTGTNVQISNDTLYPMICLKSLYNADPTYQPYAMSNAELTTAEKQNENNILSVANRQHIIVSPSRSNKAILAITANGTITSDMRGSILISMAYQSDSYLPSLVLVNFNGTGFGGLFKWLAGSDAEGGTITAAQRSSDYTTLYLTVRGSSFTAPMLIPLMHEYPEFSWQWLDAIPT